VLLLLVAGCGPLLLGGTGVLVLAGSGGSGPVPAGISAMAGLPAPLAAAYAAAAAAAGEIAPGCTGVRWSILAGVGQVESGQASGRTVQADGTVVPPVVGPRLDGSGVGGNTTVFFDTDGGQWGGGSLTGPSEGFARGRGTVGFDCSGLTRYAYAQAGITLPRVSTDQFRAGSRVPREAGVAALVPGDLVFFAFNPVTGAGVHHVGIYVGGGRMVNAPRTGTTVRVEPMWLDSYAGGVRLTGGRREAAQPGGVVGGGSCTRRRGGGVVAVTGSQRRRGSRRRGTRDRAPPNPRVGDHPARPHRCVGDHRSGRVPGS